MKKLLIVCAFILGAVTFASAQGGGQGGGRQAMAPEDRVKQLDEKVKLTDDQKTKVLAVYTEQRAAQQKMREEMQAGGGDMAAMREKMTKMTADTDAKLNAIFTDEQKAAYKTWQDELKAAREKMMRERQGGGGGK